MGKKGIIELLFVCRHTAGRAGGPSGKDRALLAGERSGWSFPEKTERGACRGRKAIVSLRLVRGLVTRREVSVKLRRDIYEMQD